MRRDGDSGREIDAHTQHLEGLRREVNALRFYDAGCATGVRPEIVGKHFGTRHVSVTVGSSFAKA